MDLRFAKWNVSTPQASFMDVQMLRIAPDEMVPHRTESRERTRTLRMRTQVLWQRALHKGNSTLYRGDVELENSVDLPHQMLYNMQNFERRSS